MVLHFKNDLRGLHHPRDRRPLPRHYLDADPDRRPGQRRGLPARRGRQAAGQRRVQVRVGHAAAPSCASPRTRTTRASRRASRPTSTTLIFKWYGDADAMIAGFRAGEVDIATDLQDSDIAEGPGPRRPGQRRSRPRCTSSCARTGPTDRSTRRRQSAAARATRRSPTAARAARWPTRPCARRSPTRSTRTRSTRGSWAAPSRSPTRTSPPAPGSSRTRPRPPSIRPRPSEILEAAGWTDGDGDGIREKDGLKAKIELCTTTRQVRQDTLALIADWLKDVGIEARRRTRSTPTAIFADYNEATRRDRRASSRRATSTSRSTRSRSSIDPLGNYFSYHSSQFEPDRRERRPGQRHRHRRGARHRQEQRRLRR